ncbi:MAG: addiction module toxin, HicA family [Chloroflexota bacterium]|nr:MAG: addiction module toxin, HicA family [Chloroflexota bacterium]
MSRAGSHRTYRKYLPHEQRHLTTVVVLGKREVPRGTLQRILELAEMSHERFRLLAAQCR